MKEAKICNHFAWRALIVTTHQIIKKTEKIPKAEIEKAKAIMKQYFEQKSKK